MSVPTVTSSGVGPGPSGIRVLRSVPYASVTGHRPLEMDLYLPDRVASSVPVVVHLHGGGWRRGSRRSAGPAYDGWSPTPFERLALAGIAVASVDYRLTGEECWPAQLHDGKAAVRWLRHHASELDLDPLRIAAWGESAGGHLAALLGLTGRSAELEGTVGVTGVPSTVCAVAAWYAPSDLPMIAPEAGTDPLAADSPEADLLGGPVPTVMDLAREASPVHHVAGGAPPFLILHGREDKVVPWIQSERLRDALRAEAVDVEFHSYPGAGHLWSRRQATAADAFARTADFFQRCLLRPC